MVKTTKGIHHFKQYLSTKKFTKGFILVDENTRQTCLPLIHELVQNFEVLEMKAGEKHKHLTTCSSIWQQLIEAGADRKSLLINLGGGVVTDLGGFVASTYKRGIQFCNLPTSLLAMVDASVGGKTGIDFLNIKNSIGTFQTPDAVFIDSVFLNTLPKRHLINGTAEILKHGLIHSATHLHNFLSMGLQDNFSQIIEESIAIKQQIVEKDPYEQGLRKILNFGHTLGHAIESYSVKNEQNYLLHGEAIALGMIAEAYLSIKYCGLSKFEFENIQASIFNYFETKHYTVHQIREMMLFLKQDKKNEHGQLNMSLLKSIGEAKFNINVSYDDAEQALNLILNEHL